MATLQNAKSPGKKIEIGDKVLCGVDAVDTTPITNRIVAFQTVHVQYSAAEMAVRAAYHAVHEQRAVSIAVDIELNEAIEALAIALPNDGFPRRQPFEPFGGSAPSVLKKMPLVEGAGEVIALEQAILRHSGISAKTSNVARAAGDTARKVLQTMAPFRVLEKAWTNAIAKRDAFAPGWEKAFSSLKLAARAADDDGHSGIFAALFERAAPPKKKASNKRNAFAKPDVAPLSAPASG